VVILYIVVVLTTTIYTCGGFQTTTIWCQKV